MFDIQDNNTSLHIHLVQEKEVEVVADMVLVGHQAVDMVVEADKEVVVEVVQHQVELVERQVVDMEAVKVLVVVQAELMEQEAAAVEVEQAVEEPMQVVKGVDMLVDMVVVKAVDLDMVAVAAMPLESLFSSQFANTIGIFSIHNYLYSIVLLKIT